MGRKPVVPAKLADALTADKPPADNRPVPAARAVSVISGEGLDDVAAKDADTLAAEIIGLQVMGNRVLLAIGRRLIAAKEKLSHGDWLPWLDSVNIPERLAQRYMKLAREWTNPTILSDLGLSRALTLLALPEAERDNFIAESHIVGGEAKSVTEMSNAELKEAIRARQDAERRLSELQTRLDESLAYNKTLYADLNESVERRNALNAELDELKRKPIDVAVEKIVDPAAIEEAKREVREELNAAITHAEISRDAANRDRDYAQRKLDEAATERDKLKISLNKMQADFEAVKRERNAEMSRADEAKHDLDFMTRKYKETNAELERVRADAQKAASLADKALADKDLALFGVLYEQVIATVNQMSGIMLKRSDEKRESMKNALLSISTQLKEAAES